MDIRTSCCIMVCPHINFDYNKMSRLPTLLFCFRSLWTEYGWFFLKKVVIRHPLKTWRGIRKYRGTSRRDTIAERDQWLRETYIRPQSAERRIVGLGFCLKPLVPECPSGRANHRCLYFESRGGIPQGDDGTACQECVIRELGSLALRAGFDLYIMTSARDILLDILLPVVEQKHDALAVLTLCRYSFEPFRIALAVTGLKGYLFEFREGDCQNYSAWRLADKGHKSERTCLQPEDLNQLLHYFKAAAAESRPFPEIKRMRNTYTPSA